MMEGLKKERKIRVGLLCEIIESRGSVSFTLKYKGEVVGMCMLYTPGERDWDFELDDLFIFSPYRRNNENNTKSEEYFGFGSELIESVNEYLLKNGKSAYLVDGIIGPESGMYQRHGWRPVKGHELLYLGFNKRD